MTRTKWTLGAAVIAAATLVGCGNDNNPPAANPTPAAPAPAAPAAPATPAAPAVPATPTAPTATETPAAPATPATPAAPAGAAAEANSAMAAAQTQADALLSQASDYIKNNKLDLADQAVTKLQGMKSSLPAEYGPKIDELKAALDAAKASGGKLPGGIKLPGQ